MRLPKLGGRVVGSVVVPVNPILPCGTVEVAAPAIIAPESLKLAEDYLKFDYHYSPQRYQGWCLHFPQPLLQRSQVL
jgi:hypothetical protein